MNATASQTDRSLGVLVGFDGSAHAQLALAYAAAEASRREVALTVATASVVPTMFYATLGSLAVPADAEIAKNAAEGVLDEARRLLHEYRGGVRYLAEVGDAGGALVELSKRADVAIVGTRGRGGFAGRVLGSVSAALAAHAHCPTIVVREQLNSDGPVTVALGDVHGGDELLELAARTALERHAALDIVTVLPPFEELTLWYPNAALDIDIVGDRQTQLDADLRARADALRTRFSGLEVSSVVEVGSPQTLLARRTRSSQLTVLGTRGRGAVASALLGSVSRSVLQHAEGTVMVVPAEE